MPGAGFGAVTVASALGEPYSVAETVGEYVDDPERVLRWGYHTYHRAKPGSAPTELAAAAAREALARAEIAPEDVDILVTANSDVPEYLQWDVSSAIARHLGLEVTPCLLFTQGCAAGATALEHVAGLFALREDLDTVLLVAVNQVSDAHTNRMRFNTCLTSDGAAAAVLRRGHPRLRWLSAELTTDPRCVDFFRVEYGGAAAPFPPEGAGNRDVDPIELVYEHFRRDPEHLVDFRLALTTRLASVVHRACARAGAKAADLARLIYINDNQPSLQAVADAVGIPIERTNAELAAAVGHCGAADHFISLDAYLTRGELREGDLVALAGLSSGMHWFCTVLEA